MKRVAIRPFGRYAAGWAEAFRAKGVDVLWVDPFSISSINSIKQCDAFFCSISHDRPADLKFLSDLLDALETSGYRVYPDREMRRGFDDKVAQHWLFQTLKVKSPASWVFFDKAEAIKFVDSAVYPLVFKLARGAGSQNVRLVAHRLEARTLIDRMFTKGLKTYPPISQLSRAIEAKRSEGIRIKDTRRLIKGMSRLLSLSFSGRNREYGYVLFQEFVAENKCDYRVTVIGERAFVFMRGIRANDFRASGSGKLVYPEPEDVDVELLKSAFEARDKLHSSTIAMDFVRDRQSGAYLLLEYSFSFIPDAVSDCAGFFDRNLSWNPVRKTAEYWIVADFIESFDSATPVHD